MAKGKIVRLVTDRGFGFIQMEGRESDVFFHRSEVRGVQFEQLLTGDPVEFDIEPDPQNPRRRRALNVKRVSQK
ncbi:MAG: cold shock domain-containing protein [Chloroflexi bacterium]|nr:cold shock domain-containing protein [Chloroflexota bacterium]